MDDDDLLAERFEEHRTRLRGLAYRMLGSSSAADDAVQETWLRLSRVDADEIENLGGWLTTVTGRICLNVLRSRRSRPEELAGPTYPIPSSSATTRPIPSARRCSQIPSGSPSSSCSTHSPRRSGSRSCCTTCSGCPSRRSLPSWAVRYPPRDNWPAVPAGGCRSLQSPPTPTCSASAKLSTRSSPPPAVVTWTRWWRCSTRTCCCVRTAGGSGWPPPRSSRAPWPWPVARSRSRCHRRPSGPCS